MPEREHYTNICIDSLLNQKFDKNYEIILAQHPDYGYKVPFTTPENITIRKIDSGKHLSAKRNDILMHAKGKYILFIDDDAFADDSWLNIMVSGAEKNGSDIFWGSIKPIFEKELPEDLMPFEMYIGGFHYDINGNLRRKGIIGCNFGIRKGLNHSRGRFIDSLGRGSKIRGGEENLFLKEYLGDRINFLQNAIVYHHIQSDKLNFKYIIYNQLNNAKSNTYMNKIIGSSNRKFIITTLLNLGKSLLPQEHYWKHLILSIYRSVGLFIGIFMYDVSN